MQLGPGTVLWRLLIHEVFIDIREFALIILTLSQKITTPYLKIPFYSSKK
jgi:hypothetical protein